MSGLRFRVGELALIAEALPHYRPVGPGSVGFIVAIGAVDALGTQFYYEVDCPESDWVLGFNDHQLHKIDPPAEPVEMTRAEEVGV